MCAHLARCRLNKTNYKTLMIDEVIADLGCDRTPEFAEAMKPKIQSALKHRVKGWRRRAASVWAKWELALCGSHTRAGIQLP